MKPPIRKSIRLKEYDYTQNGVNFITACTQEKQHLFWNVGAIMDRPPKQPELSRIGLIAKKPINKIPEIYPTVHIQKCTVMPNHVHADRCCIEPIILTGVP